MQPHVTGGPEVLPRPDAGYQATSLRSFDPIRGAEAPPAVEMRLGGPRPWEAAYLGQDVSRFFYRWGCGLAAVLTRLRGRYDGDLDRFALHLALMLTDLAATQAVETARSLGVEPAGRRVKGLNILSLAEITGVPRESVRRKLTQMADQGLVTRDEAGLWRLGPTSDVDRFFYALSPLFWQGVRPD
ncbi:MAG: hypothetical protein IT546_12105 [Caulobacteraceae bacterium]|nr:hypothetical protein [Caulobacteraceae bacterium]